MKLGKLRFFIHDGWQLGFVKYNHGESIGHILDWTVAMGLFSIHKFK